MDTVLHHHRSLLQLKGLFEPEKTIQVRRPSVKNMDSCIATIMTTTPRVFSVRLQYGGCRVAALKYTDVRNQHYLVTVQTSDVCLTGNFFSASKVGNECICCGDLGLLRRRGMYALRFHERLKFLHTQTSVYLFNSFTGEERVMMELSSKGPLGGMLVECMAVGICVFFTNRNLSNDTVN